MTTRWTLGSLGAPALLVTFALFGSIATANAGQPWSCLCKGVAKRFIASTNACEKSQPKNNPAVFSPTGRRVLTPCTQSEFKAWNRRACEQEGCRLKW